jgi:hypothetical protein
MLRIFGPKTEGATEDWRRQYNEDLHNLYASPNIIKVAKSGKIKWVGRVARMGKMRNACKIFIGNYEGKISFWRHRNIWEDNMKMAVTET